MHQKQIHYINQIKQSVYNHLQYFYKLNKYTYLSVKTDKFFIFFYLNFIIIIGLIYLLKIFQKENTLAIQFINTLFIISPFFIIFNPLISTILAYLLKITQGLFSNKYLYSTVLKIQIGLSTLTTTLTFITFYLYLKYDCFYSITTKPLYLNFIDTNPTVFSIITWLKSYNFLTEWSFTFEQLPFTMLILVTTVSNIVHIYSIDYMKEDPHLPKFISYLSLFTFFMILLVTANNLLQLFIGWEGVGLCSYLLINFWSTRIQANKAAIKALLMNRISDLCFIFGIIGIFNICGNLEFPVIFNSIHYIVKENSTYIFILNLCLMIAAIGKSAQIGLHTWLPDAMEGPTPVSALIHAATMVTAGIFLLIKCSPVLEYSQEILYIIMFLGSLTSFITATIAVVQNDIKKIIAYPTCSQLGYMFLACGISTYNISLYHLINHGFFKALLFLAAGCIIHNCQNEQDIRKLGGLLNFLPLTYVLIFIGSLSLIGFPFLSGFYSKDAILEYSIGSFHSITNTIFFFGSCTAAITAFYSIRLLILTFFCNPNGFKNIYLTIHETNNYIIIILFFLILGAVFSGYLLKELFIGIATPFWTNQIHIIHKHFQQLDVEYLTTINKYTNLLILHNFKSIPIICVSVGIFLAIYIYYKHNITIIAPFKKNNIKVQKINFTVYKKMKNLYYFLSTKWFFDKIYNDYIVYTFLHFNKNYNIKLLDKGFFEYIGPTGIIYFIKKYNQNITISNKGFIFQYLNLFMIGFIFYVLIFF